MREFDQISRLENEQNEMKKQTATAPIIKVDDYIALQPQEVRVHLNKLRSTILKAAPKAEETISYRMPAYKYHGILIYFAAFKKHYSVFVRPTYLDHFRKELKDYKTTKSSVHFPLQQKVPVSLVTRIVKHAVKCNLEHQMKKSK